MYSTLVNVITTLLGNDNILQLGMLEMSGSGTESW